MDFVNYVSSMASSLDVGNGAEFIFVITFDVRSSLYIFPGLTRFWKLSTKISVVIGDFHDVANFYGQSFFI